MKRNGSINYLSFPFGETVVTLAEDRGKLGINQWGEFFSRNFLDPAGKFSCCSPDLERLIVDSGAKRGSVISVVKEKYGAGAIWRVKLLGAAPTPITMTPKTNGAVDHAWRDVPHSPIPESKFAPAPADGELVAKLAESVAMVQAEKAAPAVQRTEVNDLLSRCAIAAIDAARAAEAYAAAHGFPLKFREESIQAWASTLFIQSSKQANINLMHRNDSLRRENGRG